MYCGHCGAAVGDDDTFCNACGARFVDEAGATAPDPWAATGAAAMPTVAGSAAAPLPPPGTPTAPGASAATGVDPTAAIGTTWLADPTQAMPTAPSTLPPAAGDVPPTAYVPLTPGPRSGGWRPFAIGAAFAVVVVAGVLAYLALRDDDTSTAPNPSGPSVLAATTTTSSIAPTTTLPPTTVAPTVAVTEAPTVPPTEAPTTAAPVPATTGAGPTPTVAPITVITQATVAPTSAAPAPTQPAPTTPRATAAPTSRAPATTAAVAGNVPADMSASVRAVRSSATRGDSVDSCGKPTDYSPVNLLDGDMSSAWMTVGSGGGQYVDFTLRKGVEVSTVGLVPGYAKQDPCTGSNRFLDMRRIAEVSWSFDGGEEIIQQFDVESPTMQTIDLPAPVEAESVRMTIRVTTPPGTAGFDYAPVSEVTLS